MELLFAAQREKGSQTTDMATFQSYHYDTCRTLIGSIFQPKHPIDVSNNMSKFQ